MTEKKKNEFFKNVIKKMDDEFTQMASDGTASSDIITYIDTGAYALNALLSGSLYGGFPDNKVLCLAGETTTGKTFFALGLAKKFLEGKSAGVVYLNSEHTIHGDLLQERGIDPDSVVVSNPETLEEFQDKAINWYDEYSSYKGKDKPRMMFVLNSLGELAMHKEMVDAQKSADKNEGNQASDPGKRSQVIEQIFRILRSKLAREHIPLIITNHTYEGPAPRPGMPPVRRMNGGKGPYYSSDTILWLTKSKLADKDKIVLGSIITVKTHKSRFTKQDQEVDVLIHFDKGLDRYYGLLDLCLRFGLFKKVASKIELPDGRKVFEVHIERNGEKYFTQDILDQLEPLVASAFKYGGTGLDRFEEENTDENEEI